MMSNSNYNGLTTSKAHSHWVLWPEQFGRKLVLGTRRKWPRPRRDVGTSRGRLETETSRPRPQPCLKACCTRAIFVARFYRYVAW